MSIDSFQGSIVQAEILSNSILSEVSKIGCPLYTFAHNAAIGSGYLLLSIGQKVYSDPHSLIGGLSANYIGIGLNKALSKLDVKSTIISTAAVRLNPFEPLKTEDSKWIESLLNKHSSILKELVLNNRKNISVIINKNQEKALSGESFSSRQALELGLIDGIEDFYSVALKEFPTAKILEFKPRLPRGHENRSSYNSAVESIPLELIYDYMEEIDLEGIQLRSPIL